MTVENVTDFKFDRWTLRYRNRDLETEYMEHAPHALIRAVRPLVLAMMPILFVMAAMELGGLISLPAGWLSAVGLAVMLAMLLLVAFYASAWVEYAVLAVFVGTAVLMLSTAENEADFSRLIPGLLLVVLLSNYVHIRYIFGIVGAAAVMIVVTAFSFAREFNPIYLIDVSLYLVIGLLASISISYTVERQRRRLYAQVKRLAIERDNQARLALHDSLTGLPNRLLLRERMGQSLARAKRHHGQFAVLFVDLDDFKSVNDTYGHNVGDDVLRQIAQHLKDKVRDEDTVARIGGDEFVVLSEHINDDRGAQIAAARIQDAVAQECKAKSVRDDTMYIQVTCSIGIALCPRDGDSLDDLINRADTAMYRAKRAGKDQTQFFNSEGNDDDPNSKATRSAS